MNIFQETKDVWSSYKSVRFKGKVFSCHHEQHGKDKFFPSCMSSKNHYLRNLLINEFSVFGCIFR